MLRGRGRGAEGLRSLDPRSTDPPWRMAASNPSPSANAHEQRAVRRGFVPRTGSATSLVPVMRSMATMLQYVRYGEPRRSTGNSHGHRRRPWNGPCPASSGRRQSPADRRHCAEVSREISQEERRKKGERLMRSRLWLWLVATNRATQGLQGQYRGVSRGDDDGTATLSAWPPQRPAYLWQSWLTGIGKVSPLLLLPVGLRARSGLALGSRTGRGRRQPIRGMRRAVMAHPWRVFLGVVVLVLLVRLSFSVLRRPQHSLTGEEEEEDGSGRGKEEKPPNYGLGLAKTQTVPIATSRI